MRRLLTLVFAATVIVAPMSVARANPAPAKCGVHPVHYLAAGNLPKSYTAHVRDVKGLDLTFEVTLRGGYLNNAGEVVAMQAKSTFRTTDPADTAYLDNSYFGGWEVDTRRTGTGQLWVPDADGEWIGGEPTCAGAGPEVTSFAGRITVRDVKGVIDTVSYHAVQSGAPALPW